MDCEGHRRYGLGSHYMEFEPAICFKPAVYQMTGLLVGLLSRTEQPEGFVH